MEDQKLRTPCDSINAKKDSWSKEISEIRSILQELVGKLTTIGPQNEVLVNENRNPSPAPPLFRDKHASVNFGRFCGDNPESWIFQAEHYFEFYGIAEKHKLSLASLYLDGEALEWYRWLFQNRQLADWKHFTAKVMICFRKQHLESQRCRLANLRQVTSMIEYQSRFEAISSGFGESAVVSPCPAYVHPYRSNATTSLLPQRYNEHSECKSNSDTHKVFDEMLDKKTESVADVETLVLPETQMDQMSDKEPEKYTDVDALSNDTSESNTEVKAPEGMNTHEIGVMRCLVQAKHDALAELTINEDALVQIPDEGIDISVQKANDIFDKHLREDQLMFPSIKLYSLDQVLGAINIPVEIILLRKITPIGSSESTCFSWLSFKPFCHGIDDNGSMAFAQPRTLVIKSLARTVRRVEDTERMLDEVSQFPYDPGQHGLGLAQHWEEMPFIPSACSYSKILSRGIFDHFSTIDHAAVILTFHQVCRKQFKLGFPFDPGSSLFTTFRRAIQNDVCLGAMGSMNCAKFTTLIWGNSCVSPLELKFRNTNKVHKDVLVAVTLYGRHYARHFVACSLCLLPRLAEVLDKGVESLEFQGPGGSTTPCELIKKKVSVEVNILMLLWADRISVHVLTRTSFMTTYDEDTAASFQDVDIHYVTCLRNHVDGESLSMDLKLFIMVPLSQQTVIMDYDSSNGESQSSIVLFVGGSSLWAWQYAGTLHIFLAELILKLVSKIGNAEIFNVNALILICPNGISNLNLEDKVLIHDGSTVVNQPNYTRAYGLEAPNENDSVKIIGLTKMLESFIWDPGPISI